MLNRLIIAVLTGCIALPALAEPPRVATDILPIQSLVAQVMDGIAIPALIVPPGASPHGHAMRPSEARALQEADLVIWVGPALTPWMQGALDNLAPNAEVIALLEAEGTILHDVRNGPEDNDGHDDDDHTHDGIDPHAWLDPENGKLWLNLIAERLSTLDPENAARYGKNAIRGQALIDTVIAEIETKIAPLRSKPYIVFHDAYQYFEHRFDLPSAGAISLSDAAAPGPAHLSEIRDTIKETGVTCVFAEAQFSPALVDTVIDGTGARTATLDPLGTALVAGPALYPGLLSAMASDIQNCL